MLVEMKTRKIRVLRFFNSNYYDWYEEERKRLFDYTDWIEVLESDFQLLNKYISKVARYDKFNYAIIEVVSEDDFKEEIFPHILELAKKEEEQEKRAAIKAKKAAQTRQTNKRKKELQKLEELKKKYEAKE